LVILGAGSGVTTRGRLCSEADSAWLKIRNVTTPRTILMLNIGFQLFSVCRFNFWGGSVWLSSGDFYL